MAKPKEITGLDASKKSLAWVSKILLIRFDEMAEFRHAATGFSEIKGVHDMRVAARRLRSALRDIEPFLDKGSIKEIKKELKQISDALGAVRDRDVAIGALKKMSDEAEGDLVKLGIDEMMKEHRSARDAARADLEQVITAENIDGLQKRFAAAIKDAVKNAASKKLSFDDAAGQMVCANLQDMLDLAPKLYTPFKRKGLHNLRIAAKRLRYSIELFALSRADAVKPLAKTISRMQDHLGELHDCDLWIEELGKRLTAEPDENERAAAAWLLPIFVRRQNKEYLSSLELWEDWQRSDLAGQIGALAA